MQKSTITLLNGLVANMEVLTFENFGHKIYIEHFDAGNSCDLEHKFQT